MRIKLQSPIVITCNSVIGRFIAKQCVFATHALVISFYIFIVAANYGKLDDPLDRLARRSARYLEYPVYGIGKPIIDHSSYDSRRWEVPADLGIIQRPRVQYSSAPGHFEYIQGQIRMYDTWLFTPSFNFHMTLSVVVYLLIFNALSWLYRQALTLRSTRTQP